MRSYSHLSEDEKRPDRRFAGRGAVDGGQLPGRSVGRSSHSSPGSCSRNALPLGGYFRRLHAAGAYQLRQGGVKRSSNEKAALRLFVGDRLAEGWTPGTQIAGWLKSGR